MGTYPFVSLKIIQTVRLITLPYGGTTDKAFFASACPVIINPHASMPPCVKTAMRLNPWRFFSSTKSLNRFICDAIEEQMNKEHR